MGSEVFFSMAAHTVIRFVSISAKIWHLHHRGSEWDTPSKLKKHTWALECSYFSFNKCPIYTHDSAISKFSISLEETDYSPERSKIFV